MVFTSSTAMMSAVCASVVEDEPQEGNPRFRIFRFNQVLRAARGAKASPGTQQRPDEAESPRKNARRRASEQKRQIRARKQEKGAAGDLPAKEGAWGLEAAGEG